MDTFKENNDPISVGIISSAFGKDDNIVDYIKDSTQVDDWDFEVVSHGYYHRKPLLILNPKSYLI